VVNKHLISSVAVIRRGRSQLTRECGPDRVTPIPRTPRQSRGRHYPRFIVALARHKFFRRQNCLLDTPHSPHARPPLPATLVVENCEGIAADELLAYMSISMRSAPRRERTMLETPILIVIVVLVIAAIVWWPYR
jgi:hypothetical protein